MGAIALIIAGYFVYDRVMPVSSKASIVSIKPHTEEGWLEIYVRFAKQRDCEWGSLAWYSGSRSEGFKRIQLKFGDAKDDSDQTRPEGAQQAGPWYLKTDEDTLLYRSFAEVNHKCHPFFETTSTFYN